METLLDTTPAAPMAAPTAIPVGRAWYLDGACRGLESAIFYPDPDNEADVARGLEVCAGCVVRDACLDQALTRRETTGIWGGTTERERRRILRRRRSD